MKLGSLKLKPNTKIMMMGTREEGLVRRYLLALAPRPPNPFSPLFFFWFPPLLLILLLETPPFFSLPSAYLLSFLLISLPTRFWVFSSRSPRSSSPPLWPSPPPPGGGLTRFALAQEEVLAPPPENDDVVNDFDIEEEVIEVENRSDAVAKRNNVSRGSKS